MYGKNKFKIQCSFLTKVLLNLKSKPDRKDIVLRCVFEPTHKITKLI